jgi:hypothetical protein
MKIKKIILAITSVTIFFSFLTNFQSINKYKLDNVFALGDNMRRIYVYPENALTKDGWDNGFLYIHYWGGSSSSTYSSAPEMIRAIDDYYLGLFYYDIPNDSTNFMIASYRNTLKDWEKTIDVSLNSSNDFLGFKIINVYVAGKLDVFQESISMSAANFTGILYHINSCGTGYASGYNSYEYLIRTFIKKEDGTNIMGTTEQALFTTTYFNDINEGESFSLSPDVRSTNNTSIYQKLSVLQRQFNANPNNSDIIYI